MNGPTTPLRIATISVHACPLAAPGAWETGGMNVYIREVSRHLSKVGVHVDVFTRRQGPTGSGMDEATVVQFAEHARVIHVDAGPPCYLPKEEVVAYLPEFICNMRDFIRDEEGSYDIVHSHYWLSGRVSGYFKNVWHVPMVAMFHTLAELKNQVSLGDDEHESAVRVGIERLTVATADRVVAATMSDSDHLEQFYDADMSRITIVPCGVDIAKFHPGHPQAARLALGLPDKAVILFVGRIQQLKGVEILLRAAAILKSRVDEGKVPEFCLVIVGGRPGQGDDPQSRELDRLHALAKELGVEHLIRWVGAVDHDVLPRYYQAANVTVMPSTYESFGLVAVESMACGTPVVAARVGGLQTTVQDGETGYLIHAREPALYADRIQEIVTQPELQSRLGKAARRRAATFGWEHVARQLAGLYDDLIREQRAGAPPATVLQQ